jgi:hypothetical protein
MRFLIKVAFWLAVVVLLLPTDAGKQHDDTRTQVGAIEAFGAAQAAVEDAGAFCARQPAACEVGSLAFQTFGDKALHGAKLLYQFLAARFGAVDTATGSISYERRPGKQTLTPDDIAPAWSGPDQPVPTPARRPL